ncbi:MULTISPECIES: hypothetical protein [Micromonospora]|uniref:Polysaccharide pyruvyl transferase n=1 Tax=Micromonospora yangpuensis TaxID=683228 RepID=A0A1C6UG21_9ACTN|nr:hypothetical protein [Micromonospora yangpuensis]GGM05215.1 hypothetical protein GCM10012279_23620 [Micromonospora yangpuensis]SCL52987.1 hypothetical protein GA0070617_2235 [Micromonospora yangpuensis]
MHHANHFYGHAHVLARYCGLGAGHPPRIDGYVQHGWNVGDGLAPGHPYVAGTPSLLWSEPTRRRAWSLGRRNVVVIGAPFAYLLAMRPDDPPAERREGTIWYPFHGWEGQRVHGDHRRLIAEIRATEPGPVTVCLYWQEYRTTRIRRHYEEAGFRVVCHGYRGHWWRDTDPDFLDRQLTELRRHRRVASNRLTSAIFYGIAAGCEPAVYGDPMTLADDDPTFGGTARIRRQWPQLHGARIDPGLAAGIAREELGTDHRCSPAELRELLGWSRGREVTGER